MASRVDAELEHCEVTSMADIVAPSLAGPCLADDLIAVREDGDPPVGVRETADGVEEVPIEVPKRKRAAALARNLLMPYDKSAALLLWGALGLVVILLLETIACMIVLGPGRDRRLLRLPPRRWSRSTPTTRSPTVPAA